MRHKKILLIDDDKEYASLLNRNLQKDGFQTKSVKDGEEAIQLLSSSSYSPDLLLIDLMMPKMSGLELINNLRKRKLLKNSKICILSAKNNIVEIENLFKAGAHEYFLKSDNLLVILEKLYELMEIESRPIPDKSSDFISVLEITNVIHDFKVLDFNENSVKLISAEEVPIHSTIQIKNERLKNFKNTSRPINCQVEECRIIEDEIIITCNFLDQAA